MKNTLWNVLTLLTLAVLLVVVVVFLILFTNPDSSLNPFPPPAEPTLLVLPTATATPRQLPPIWTPTPDLSSTPAPPGG